MEMLEIIELCMDTVSQYYQTSYRDDPHAMRRQDAALMGRQQVAPEISMSMGMNSDRVGSCRVIQHSSHIDRRLLHDQSKFYILVISGQRSLYIVPQTKS